MFEYTESYLKDFLFENNKVFFEVTIRCNMECYYCTYGELYQNSDSTSKSDLDFLIAKQLLDYLLKIWNSKKNRSFGKDIWICFYGGEPLLNFNLIKKIVEYTDSNKLKYDRFRYSLTTNGLLLDKYSEFLVKKNFNLLISLDGDERNNGYRLLKNKKHSYTKVIKNVFTLRKNNKKYFTENIKFNSVLSDKNSVESIYDFMINSFEKKPKISELDTTFIRPDKEKEFKKIYNTFANSINSSKKKSFLEKEYLMESPKGKFLVDYVYNNKKYFIKSFNDLLVDSNNNQSMTGSCIPLKHRIFLDTNGNIFPCERVSKDHVMGKVSKDGVDIWFKKISKKYNKIFKILSDHCETCYRKSSCPVCILKIEKIRTNYKCPSWINDKEYAKKLHEAKNFLAENRDLYPKISREIFFG